jgi:glutathione S-transferase
MIRLIGIAGSHPSLAAELALRRKGLPYRRFDLPNGFHRWLLPLLGYRSRTVPVARIDGRRVAGSIPIAHALDALVPRPALLPADATARAAVVRAEQWGDAELQEHVRALARWAVERDPPAMATFLDGVRMGLPPAAVRASLPLLRPAVLRFIHVPDAAGRQALEGLARDLDEVDRLLAEGVIGGGEPTAADLQVATSVRLALCLDDLRAWIDARPAGALARRLCPVYPGRIRPVLPAEWLRAAGAP